MSIVAVAKGLGLIEQTLRNRVSAAGAGRYQAVDTKPVTPKQMELSRLRAENARLKMHADTSGNRVTACHKWRFKATTSF